MCDRQELLVGYLYDEVSAAEQREIEAHLAGCAECRAELAGLRSTREHLTLWAPPEPDLGFRVIRGGAAPAPALPRRFRLAPAFGFAAAAVIVLAVAAAIANVEVRYGNDGMTVRTGWARGGADATITATAAAPPAPAEGVRTVAATGSPAFEELDRRLRELEATLNGASGTARVAQTVPAPGMTDSDMLRRVSDIVTAAERRQQVAVAEQLLQVVQDFQRQRRADLAMLQQGNAQYQGMTNAELAQTRDIVNHLMRVATRQEK